MICLGVDPGLSGAISAICSRRGLLAVEDLPVCSNGLEKAKVMRWLDVKALSDILADWSNRFEFHKESVLAFLERSIPMPSQTVWTAASCFDSVGALRATVALKGYELHMISPNEWKRFYKLGKDKSESREIASRLYPGAADKFKRVKDDGRAESALIARYGLRKMA